MTVEEYREAYQQTEKVRDISAQLVYDEVKISIKGLIGSGRSIVADRYRFLWKTATRVFKPSISLKNNLLLHKDCFTARKTLTCSSK